MNHLAQYLNRLPVRTRSIIQTSIYGLSAGLVAVAFHLVIHGLYTNGIERFSHGSASTFLIGSFATLTITSLVAGLLLQFICPDAAGSGIPQLKVAFWENFGVLKLRMFFVKFIAGALTIGGGSSLGREGPTVQLGSIIASNAGRFMGVAKQNRRIGCAAGAAAGLAAAFNTPLTAITFVLEEIIEDLNSRLLGSVILASLLGAIVVHAILGEEPAFQMAHIERHTWTVYLMVPFVAGFSALSGVAFHRLTLWVRGLSKGKIPIPKWLQPCVGAWITWILGASVFLGTGHLGVFGLGYDDLTSALNNNLTWQIAGILLVTKLLATCACYGWGGCGGIFAPTLFLGGMSALFFTGFIEMLIPLSDNDKMLLAVVGLSSCLGAVVRAPMTSILIVFEMTRQFSLVPALLIGCLISQWIGRSLTKTNFYEAVLSQDGHDLHKVVPPRDLSGYRKLPISAIANFSPALISDISIPALAILLEEDKHSRWPVVVDGELKGILGRREAEDALRENRDPVLAEATTCMRGLTIGDVQVMVIDAAEGLVIVLEKEGGSPAAVVTLHDLLRAEAAMGKRMAGV